MDSGHKYPKVSSWQPLFNMTFGVFSNKSVPPLVSSTAEPRDVVMRKTHSLLPQWFSRIFSMWNKPRSHIFVIRSMYYTYFAPSTIQSSLIQLIYCGVPSLQSIAPISLFIYTFSTLFQKHL